MKQGSFMEILKSGMYVKITYKKESKKEYCEGNVDSVDGDKSVTIYVKHPDNTLGQLITILKEDIKNLTLV